MTVVCDDCVRDHPAPPDAGRCYAHCSFCGIKRACRGDDPDPLPARHFFDQTTGGNVTTETKVAEYERLLKQAWLLLEVAHSAHQKMGLEGCGASGLPHETRMFAADFSKAEEPKTPQHIILTGTGAYQKWRDEAKAALSGSGAR